MATAPKPTKESPSPIIPIYFTCVTDGVIPGQSNLLHIHAQFSPEVQWSANILPQTGRIHTGKGIGPELQRSLSLKALPISTAIRELSEWLERFKGKRRAITSCVAHWHLIYHMHQVLGETIPLLNNPIDTTSFWCGAKGDLSASPVGPRGKDPVRGFSQRRKLIEEAIELAGEVKW
jgi:hypothetical protein